MTKVNVCDSVPDITLTGPGSTFQCVTCGHIWKVEDDGYGKLWTDSSKDYWDDEEYANLWARQITKSDALRKASFITGIILLLVSVTSRFTPFYVIATPLNIASFVVLAGGIMTALHMSSNLQKRHRHLSPLNGFLQPRKWPCRVQTQTLNMESLSAEKPS